MSDYTKAIELFKKGYSLRKIERVTGINDGKLSKHLKGLGFLIASRVGNSGYNKYLVWEEAKKRYLESGMQKSIKKICKELHTTPVSFTKWLREQGFDIKPSTKPRNAELETKKLEQCMELRKQGYTLHKISRMVKINRSKLSDFLMDQGIDSYAEKRISVNNSIFEKINTRQKAYWLGFLYADGYVFFDGIRYGLELTLKEEDYEHLVKFKVFMETEAEICPKEIRLNGKIHKAYRISIFSKKVAADLIALGCVQRKSLVLKFPNEKIVPKEFLLDFIRGYFDGDGSLYIPVKIGKQQPSIGILGTKEFLLGLRSVLNLNPTKLQKKGQAFATSHGGMVQTYLFLKKIYENAPVFLDRKFQKYQKFLNILNEHYAQSKLARIYFEKKTGEEFIITNLQNSSHLLL